MDFTEWFDRLGGLTPIEGNLHRCAIPMRPEHFRTLQEAGIRVLYSMEEDVPGPLVLEHGFDWRPHFWTDNAPPTPEQVERFVTDYLSVPDDMPVAVHCRAGWGRAGTAIACALVARHGWSADRALKHLWAQVPNSEKIMTRYGQADFVRGYAAARQGRGLYGAD